MNLKTWAQIYSKYKILSNLFVTTQNSRTRFFHLGEFSH